MRLLLVLLLALPLAAAPVPRTPVEVSTASKHAPRAAPQQKSSATVDLIVQFRPAGRIEQFRRDLDRIDATWRSKRGVMEHDPPRVKQTFSRVLHGAGIRVRRELRDAIAALPYVASVHVERRFEPLLASSVAHIRADRVWQQRSTRGKGVRVAVIDSGIDYTHAALTANYTGGWDFVNDDGDPMDDHGHGTHVAGIIAGNGGGLTGVAPEASLVAYKVIHASGFAEEADVIAAIERTVDPDQNGDTSDHIDVVNMSLGGPALGADDPAAKAVEAATAAGVLFCIANGNGGDYGDINTPAIAPSAISVGAANREDRIASFSSRGPAFTYGIKPEVSAPGVDIVSSVLQGRNAAASGTSMAAPHVAGVAALVKSLHPGWSPADIKSAIVTASAPLSEEVMIAGSGRLDALNAISVTALANPAVVNFGRVDGKQAIWRATQTFSLRNVSEQAQTLTATITGLREGVHVRAIPEAVTLAAGESKDVSVELTVTNAAVPAPREGSLSFGGRIVWNGGAVPLHLPWAFVKGTFLTIEVPDGNGSPFHAAILADRRKHSTRLFAPRMHVLWPLERVDVVITEFDYPARVVVAEDVDLASSSFISTPIAAAQLTVSTDTTDPAGKPLAAPDRQCQEEIILSFPGGKKVSYAQALGYEKVSFGRLSPRVKVYLASSCADAARNTLYASMHEPFNGLENHVTSTLRPRWLRQELRFVPEINSERRVTAALPVMRFPGPEELYFLNGGQFYLMQYTESHLTVFFTPSPAPEVDLFSYVERWGQCHNEDLGHLVDCPVVDNILLYLNEQTVTADADLFLEISPMAYQLPLGTPMTFGLAPVSPRASFVSVDGFWAAVASWMGPLGERRFRDTAEAKLSLYDANGTLVREELAGMLSNDTLPRGPYRVESVDPHLVVAGVKGQGSFIGHVDTTRSDAYLPLITALRVADAGGTQTTLVEQNAPASLLFSVADVTPGGLGVIRVPPRESATRVEYRVHGTSEWRPLTPIAAARHYQNNSFFHGGVGTMYRVDLSTVTREVTGVVDVRLFVEDEAGNSVELRLEPAFAVGVSTRRRAVR